jgi:hypothetical protein
MQGMIRMIRREEIRLRRVPVDTRLVSSLVVAGLGVGVDLVGSMMEDPDSRTEALKAFCLLHSMYIYISMALLDRTRTSF